MSFAQVKSAFQHAYRRQTAVTPSDSTDLPNGEAVIYCLTAGNVVIQNAAGETVTYALTPNQQAPALAKRVLATGTSGTYIALS